MWIYSYSLLLQQLSENFRSLVTRQKEAALCTLILTMSLLIYNSSPILYKYIIFYIVSTYIFLRNFIQQCTGRNLFI